MREKCRKHAGNKTQVGWRYHQQVQQDSHTYADRLLFCNTGTVMAYQKPVAGTSSAAFSVVLVTPDTPENQSSSHIMVGSALLSC